MANVLDELGAIILDEAGMAIMDETIAPTPGIGKNPTGWNFNPLASQADLIEYDTVTEPYDNEQQPYDGYASTFPSPNTPKTPTAYTPLSELYQQYYGGPSYVPLYAAPSHWVFNPGLVNQSGQYVTTAGAEANLYPYDQSNRLYDNDNPDTDYDGTNGAESFYSDKAPTQWTQLTGGSL
jgi:hypothetical protein